MSRALDCKPIGLDPVQQRTVHFTTRGADYAVLAGKSHRRLFIAGVPATGKSLLGQWLAENHGYIHIDAERDGGADLDRVGIHNKWDDLISTGRACSPSSLRTPSRGSSSRSPSRPATRLRRRNRAGPRSDRRCGGWGSHHQTCGSPMASPRRRLPRPTREGAAASRHLEHRRNRQRRKLRFGRPRPTARRIR